MTIQIPDGRAVKLEHNSRLSFLRLFNSPKPLESGMVQNRVNRYSVVQKWFIWSMLATDGTNTCW